MKNTKKYIIAGIVLIAVVFGAIFALKQGGHEAGDKARWSGITGEPAEIVTDFYQKWINSRAANQDAATLKSFLAGEPLAEQVRTEIASGKFTDIDPVLCRSSESDATRVQVGFVTDTAAQILVLAPSADFNAGYAVVDLTGKEGSWQIEKITCAMGELVPEKKEFTFDKEGALTKQVPPPFAAGKWHLIFKDDTQVGLVPLQIGNETVCKQANGSSVACDDAFLVEGSDVHVYGSMTETGVEVARIERK